MEVRVPVDVRGEGGEPRCIDAELAGLEVQVAVPGGLARVGMEVPLHLHMREA